MKNELVVNIDDLDNVSKLMDELLCATNNHKIIKRFFWNVINTLFIIAILLLYAFKYVYY